MKARITPSTCGGTIHIPPSKSMSHRAIICASLANATSTISNIAYSKDIQTTIDGMRLLGAKIETKENSVVIEGIKDFNHLSQEEIFCSESGSTLRFFIPIFSLCNKKVVFKGAGRLLQRPQKVYEDIFAQQHLSFFQDTKSITIEQSLKAQDYTLQGDVSSQFISGLLFALPFLKEDSRIHILPPFESKSYVDLTLQMLDTFGIHASFEDETTLFIPGNQTYIATDYEVEGDYSQLAFFAVLGAIQNDIEITGVSLHSQQGDKEIIEILRSFGTHIEEIDKGYRIYKSELTAHPIDLANCPDLGPILCVLGMYSLGNTHIYHAGRLRIKESDRILAMESELKKFNASIHSNTDEIWIEGKTMSASNAELLGHNDHRIVMALSIATICSTKSCTIDEAEAINKSYPTFFDDLQKINGKVELL
ncbi:MAG: 3-phosphoshikimate 1-carboxyvinyltransferase [Longicatena sp.]